MTDKWLTIDQIAKYLQVSKEKIYKICQKGKMPAAKFGGQWRFKKDLVDTWMLKNQSPKKASRPYAKSKS
jgi:excisionase family DNA binding protein